MGMGNLLGELAFLPSLLGGGGSKWPGFWEVLPLRGGISLEQRRCGEFDFGRSEGLEEVVSRHSRSVRHGRDCFSEIDLSSTDEVLKEGYFLLPGLRISDERSGFLQVDPALSVRAVDDEILIIPADLF